ncbi:hypothetical protein KUCAC02_017744, partial [Chaenocephalus aceratus]
TSLLLVAELRVVTIKMSVQPGAMVPDHQVPQESSVFQVTQREFSGVILDGILEVNQSSQIQAD